jgi:hypothetical protein
VSDGEAAKTSVSIVGLPGSGKTTFLAALWELVQERRVAKRLRFGSLSEDDHAYLNRILKVWRSATEPARTQLTGMTSVSMNLLDEAGRMVSVAFPDVPGEEYRRMWEEREAAKKLVETLAAGNIMLLLNGNRIKAPAWVTERAVLRKAIGEPAEAEPEGWHPKHAPTQVQLVDLLQHLARPPIHVGPRRVAVMIGAWDKVEGEKLRPEPFLREKLPLLDQYLKAGRDGWTYRVYGLSAQGGEYDESDKNKKNPKPGKDAERLRDKDIAAERIRLVFGDQESHDLTEPLEWLMN